MSDRPNKYTEQDSERGAELALEILKLLDGEDSATARAALAMAREWVKLRSRVDGERATAEGLQHHWELDP